MAASSPAPGLVEPCPGGGPAGTGRRPHPQRAWGPALVASAVVLVALQIAHPDGLLGEMTYDAVTVGAAVVAWVGAARQPVGRRRPWQLIALGVSLSAVADVLYWAYEALRAPSPDASIADVFYLASYVALFAGLLRLLARRGRGQGLDAHGLIDMGVVATIAMVVLWTFSVADLLTDTSVDVPVRVLWASYPVLDAVLLGLVGRALFSRQARARVGLALVAGATCWLLADLGFMLDSENSGFLLTLDVGWMVGAALLGGAVWFHVGEPPEGLVEERLTTGRVLLGLLPLLVPGVLEMWGAVVDRDPNPLPLFVASVALVALGVARVVLLIGANRRATERLHSRERHFEALATNSSDALVVVDELGRVLETSPQLARLVGSPGPIPVGSPALGIAEQENLEEVLALLERCLASPGRVFALEIPVRLHDGQRRWHSARVVNLLGDPDVAGIVVNLQDVTGRKKAEQELAHRAFHDSLTGLANRALFVDRLDHALRRDARLGLDPAVVYLDLDGFKNVNDSLGHEAGDQLLREIGQRLMSAVRSSDTIARLGGDEFAILIDQSNRPIDEAEALAERVLQALSPPMTLGDQQVVVSASIGIAAGDAGATSSSLLRDADVAMYRAKTTGRSRWVVYDPAMRSAAVERLRVSSDLIGALDAGQLRLVYQPIVTLDDEHVVGFEALLRWHHPTLGVVGPDRFIPVAEETGLIVPIGRWVLGEACRTASRWQRAHPRDVPLTMAVNLSARQLASDTLVADVGAALADSGLPASSLVLEMTESALVRDTAVAARRLGELRTLGVKLAIDDFGTGYSSLSYLRQFPVDILKIDQSFIRTITKEGEMPAIVHGMFDLGRTLQLETVAEGVEHAVQRDQLRDEHCTHAQGYLFGRPLEPAAAELLISERSPDGGAASPEPEPQR